MALIPGLWGHILDVKFRRVTDSFLLWAVEDYRQTFNTHLLVTPLIYFEWHQHWFLIEQRHHCNPNKCDVSCFWVITRMKTWFDPNEKMPAMAHAECRICLAHKSCSCQTACQEEISPFVINRFCLRIEYDLWLLQNDQPVRCCNRMIPWFYYRNNSHEETWG